jgi:hypothetical protein
MFRRSVETLVAGFVVYGFFAACAAAGDGGGFLGASGGNTGLPGGSSAGNGATVPGTGGKGSSITDPVPSVKAEPYRSGDRIRAKYLAGSDGSRQFMGWFDTHLDVDCSFLMTSAGYRCVPIPDVYSSESYFSNAECSQPLWAAFSKPGCLTAPGMETPIGAKTVVSECVSTTTLYRLTPYSGDVYQRAGTSCLKIENTTSLVFYAELGQLDPTDYVAGEMKTE